MTTEQVASIQQNDPGFHEQSALLKSRLREAHTDLATSFENLQVGDDELLARIDDLIEAHRRLETRVAQHITLLRPLLTQEQRERLSGLCTGRHGGRNGDSAANGQAGVGMLLGAIVAGQIMASVI